MADEHTFTLIFEASGEVTPAQPHPEPDTDTTDPTPEEDEQ
ncbi:hypothetical protein ACWCRD_02975 [Streptomyces sp. NPDC002092]